VTDGSALLALDDVSSGYTDEPIVRGVSFAVSAGSVTTLVGGNGAGKSTLLRTIAGLVKHMAGRILWESVPIEGEDPRARLMRGIGFVPQGRCNFQRLSVSENLQLGGYTLPKAQAVRAIQEMVETFPVLRRKWRVAAGNLSGGEQQILEMAMVLLPRPRLLLLDEPSLGLSPKMMGDVFSTVRRIARQGMTIVMVEQNVRGALLISDHAIVLEQGRIFAEGPAKAIAEDPRIKAAYLGGEASAAA
jgi:branched-chain amino acid transport system ATP-binding protein